MHNGLQADFERLSDELSSRAKEYHGDLGLSLDDFHIRLQEVADKYIHEDALPGAYLDFVVRLWTNDLYLTTACSLPSEAAWSRFYNLYNSYIQVCLRHRCHDERILNDLTDDISIELYLPGRSGRSRIASYDGRASLNTWLRVIISRRILNERERRYNALRSEEQPVSQGASFSINLESVLFARRYEAVINRCLMTACERLSERERLMLIERYENELQLSEIAQICGVHQSTVTRGLDRAMNKFRETVIGILAVQFKLSDSVVEECLAMLAHGSIGAVSIITRLKELDTCRVVEENMSADRRAFHRRGGALSVA